MMHFDHAHMGHFIAGLLPAAHLVVMVVVVVAMLFVMPVVILGVDDHFVMVVVLFVMGVVGFRVNPASRRGENEICN